MTAKVHRDFASDLASITEVVAAAGERVYPLTIAAEEVLPAMSFTIRDGIPVSFYVNSFGLTTYDILVDIWSRSYQTNQEVADAIVSRYNGTNLQIGPVDDPTTVQRAIIDNVLNSIDSDDAGVYRTLIELTLTTGE